tara:strand:+ start:61 stop:234 length:174 start_codon:yes stop_codon:yes gene_type:complete
MKKYKYYYKSDSNKETVGVVKATSIDEAIAKAIDKKQLDPIYFDKLFNVEEIDERKN